MLAVATAMAASAAARLTLSGAEGRPGERVTVSVSLESDAPTEGLQLTLRLPDGTAYVAGSAAPAGRASAMTAGGGIREGKLNVMLYSLGATTIAAGRGEVMTFDLTLGDTPLTAQLAPEALLAAEGDVAIPCDGATVTINGAAITLSTREYSMGRVALGEEQSMSVRVTNTGTETLTLDGIAGTADWRIASPPVSIPAGGSGYVALKYVPSLRGVHDEIVRFTGNAQGADAPVIVHADGFGRNEMTLSAEPVVGGEEATVKVNLKNYDPISGFTLRVKLPRNFTYVDGSLAIDSDRGDGHATTATASTDATDGVTTLTLTSYSFSNRAFKGNDGTVATFRVLAASRTGASLSIDKAVLPTLLDGRVTDVVSATSGAYLSVSSPTFDIGRDLDLGRTPVTAPETGTIGFTNSGNARS